eukprot:CAMPEP_0179064532 /NCGR_PEP_ID=MMETSP0796-20121207/27996_1 /TAXON_ID=73915 /ORGANISM="Pyrodinium bahamense, Strain pbaha01" /LENGTH=148 /DNA_ID=CAMNT_0020761481 /DNA_START=49 /DNA_END=496 /DNA_ORIENTATION=-
MEYGTQEVKPRLLNLAIPPPKLSKSDPASRGRGQGEAAGPEPRPAPPGPRPLHRPPRHHLFHSPRPAPHQTWPPEVGPRSARRNAPGPAKGEDPTTSANDTTRYQHQTHSNSRPTKDSATSSHQESAQTIEAHNRYEAAVHVRLLQQR